MKSCAVELTPDAIAQAQQRVYGLVRHTPLLESRILNDRLGFRALFKAECLQITGSFKLRGAFHFASQLSDQQRAGGLLAFSSGNHAQAVACVARHYSVTATIVMPNSAPVIKRDNTIALGGQVVGYDIGHESREDIAAALRTKRPDMVLMKPFDDPDVILGQGTAIAEALADCQIQDVAVDHLFIPCSGGGLLAGGCLAAARHQARNKQDRPIRITACEPQGFGAVPAALAHNAPHPAFDHFPDESRLCDGLLSPLIGQHCYPIIARYVRDCASVTEPEVLHAMALLLMQLKLGVEPGGAAGLAAAMQPGRVQPKQTVLVLLSGGNVDAACIARALQHI